MRAKSVREGLRYPELSAADRRLWLAYTNLLADIEVVVRGRPCAAKIATTRNDVDALLAILRQGEQGVGAWDRALKPEAPDGE